MASIFNLSKIPLWLQPYYGLTKIRFKDGRIFSVYKQTKNVPFELAKEKFQKSPSKRTLVIGKCIVCKKEYVMIWARIYRRKRCRNISVCKKCSFKYVVSTKEWRENNSKAQKIAQNRPKVKAVMSISVKKSKTPAVLKKHSVSSKKIWNQCGFREKHKLSMQNALKKMPEESRRKMSCKNGAYTGVYDSKFGSLYFDSSLELAFIIWCENNESVVNMSRCFDHIEYMIDTKAKLYTPDFKITTKSDTYIIEIKGTGKNKKNTFFYNNNILQSKKEAAIDFYNGKANYCLYFMENLINMNVVSNNHKAKEFCKKHCDKITFLISSKKKGSNNANKSKEQNI